MERTKEEFPQEGMQIMSKIEKIVIGKGKTNRPSVDVEEWTRKYLELTIRLPEQFTSEGFQEALVHAEKIIDDWLATPEVPKIPKLDEAELAELPWKSYKTKEPCKPNEPGWIFSDLKRHEEPQQKIVLELVEAIGKAPQQKLELAQFQYAFSGQERQFISRRPLKRR